MRAATALLLARGSCCALLPPAVFAVTALPRSPAGSCRRPPALLGWRVPILRDVAELRGRCRAVLGRWSARLAARRMRQAVARGRIAAADVLMLMAGLRV